MSSISLFSVQSTLSEVDKARAGVKKADQTRWEAHQKLWEAEQIIAPSPPFTLLADELKLKILSYLPPKDLYNGALVSKEWRRLSITATIDLFRRMFKPIYDDTIENHGSQCIFTSRFFQKTLAKQLRYFPETLINACGGPESFSKIPFTQMRNVIDHFTSEAPVFKAVAKFNDNAPSIGFTVRHLSTGNKAIIVFFKIRNRYNLAALKPYQARIQCQKKYAEMVNANKHKPEDNENPILKHNFLFNRIKKGEMLTEEEFQEVDSMSREPLFYSSRRIENEQELQTTIQQFMTNTHPDFRFYETETEAAPWNALGELPSSSSSSN